MKYILGWPALRRAAASLVTPNGWMQATRGSLHALVRAVEHAASEKPAERRRNDSAAPQSASFDSNVTRRENLSIEFMSG